MAGRANSCWRGCIFAINFHPCNGQTDFRIDLPKAFPGILIPSLCHDCTFVNIHQYSEDSLQCAKALQYFATILNIFTIMPFTNLHSWFGGFENPAPAPYGPKNNLIKNIIFSIVALIPHCQTVSGALPKGTFRNFRIVDPFPLMMLNISPNTVPQFMHILHLPPGFCLGVYLGQIRLYVLY